MTAPRKIAEPGVYDLPPEAYFADPIAEGSLSSTGARKLLPPSCPAKFHYWSTHPQKSTKAMTWGSAAHAEVLGIGKPLVVVEAKDWRTKAAQAERDQALAEDKVPLLVKDHAIVKEMAAALRAHPEAGALLDPESGRPEQSLFWRDERTGLWRRAMLDWLRHTDTDEPFYVVPDYKTCESASLEALPRTLDTYQLHQQAAWYLDGVQELGLNGDRDVAFVLIFQEKDPPYLVTVAQVHPTSLLWGERLNREAIDTYLACKAADHWPGYAEEIVSLELPFWTTRELETAYDNHEPLTPYTTQDAA